MGLKGEFHVSDNVWIVKSHHPFEMPLSAKFATGKTFVCVRHPLDVFPSFAALCNTISHGNKTEFEFYRDYPDYWDWFVKKQAGSMRQFFDTLIHDCVDENKNPLYIVRYEDLVSDLKSTLMGLMAFLFEQKDLSGTNLERRIDEVVAQGSIAATTYKLKDTTGKFDIHKEKYSAELRQYVQDTLSDQLYYFGYANVDDKNPTGFFDFMKHDSENLAKFNKFRSDNAACIDRVCSPGYTNEATYVHN